MNPHLRKLGVGAALIVLTNATAIETWAAAGTTTSEAGINLSDVSNAENTVVTAKLKASDGGIVGKVHALTRGADGKIKMVQIALSDGPVVALDARGLVYLSDGNLILTVLTANQVRNLPPLQG